MLANITTEDGRRMGAIIVNYTFNCGNDAQFRHDLIDAVKNLALIDGYNEVPGPAIYTLMQIIEAFDGKLINIGEGGSDDNH